MKKRIISFILSAALMLSMVVLPAAAAESPVFPDIEGHWAKDSIEQWAQYDVVNGMDGGFYPNAEMTRGQYAAVMVRLLGLTKKSETNPFKDLKGTEWYAEDILKAYAVGIMNGLDKNLCGAEKTVSREQSFVMAGRALGVKPLEGVDLSKYEDGDEVSNWAKPIMGALINGGFVGGTSGTTLSPKDDINRASIMKLLSNTVTTYVTEPGAFTAPGTGFVVVKTPGEVTLSGEASGIIIGPSAGSSKINLENAVVAGDIKISAEKVSLNVEGSKVEGGVEITPEAEGAQMTVGAGSTIETVNTAASDVVIGGTGEVKKVDVAGGKVEISTPGTSVVVDEKAEDAEATVGGNTVKPGETTTTTGTPDGFVEPTPTPDISGGGGGGGVTPTVPTSTMTINDTALATVLNKAIEDIQVGVKVTASGTSATISGGALKYIENWTEFGGNDTSLNAGNYVVFDLKKPADITEPADDVVVMKQYTDANKNTVEKPYTYGNTFKGSDPYTYVWKVSSAAAQLYLGIDWDGDGSAYKEQFYTISLSNDVVLPGSVAANTCTVTYNNQGGSSVQDGSVSIGGTVSEPTAPTKTGYTFGGWYTEAECANLYSFASKVYRNIELYAKWEENPPLLGDTAEISFAKETNPESPYALMNVKYARKTNLDSIQVEAKVGNKVVWREKYTDSIKANENAVFTWSMRDLNPNNNLQTDQNTLTGAAAESMERTNAGIIPTGTVINITITGTKAGDNPATITVNHTVIADNVKAVWFGGWPEGDKQTSKANIDASLAALGTASFAGNLENNGYIAIPNATENVKVTLNTGGAQNTTEVILEGNVTSGIPASAPYEDDFNTSRFDPVVAANGYTAMALLNCDKQSGAHTITQANNAIALYPQSIWEDNITVKSNTVTKTKSYDSAQDIYDFLLIPGTDATITFGTDNIWEIDNNLTFTAVSAVPYILDTGNTTSGVTAKASAASKEGDHTYQVISLEGTGVASGLDSGNTYISGAFGQKPNSYSDGNFIYVSLPAFFQATETSTVTQENQMLSIYGTGSNITNSSGKWIKSKEYVKSNATGNDLLYSFLIKEGDSVNITKQVGNTYFHYTFVNHATFAAN